MEEESKLENNLKVEKKSKLKTSFNIIILVILLIALFMYVVILFNTITKKEATLNFFHWKPFIVVSDSIEANVNSGDMAIIKDVKIEEIKPGDIIVYRRGNNGAIKKVKDIRNVNGEIKIIIEDDSVIKNESINSSIEGIYMFKIAGFGNVMLFLQTPLGGIILFSIFIYIVLIIKLISSKSSKESNNTIKDEQIKEQLQENKVYEEEVNTNIVKEEIRQESKKTNKQQSNKSTAKEKNEKVKQEKRDTNKEDKKQESKKNKQQSNKSTTKDKN